MTDESPKRRPFHETIGIALKLDLLNRFGGKYLLSFLIKETDIPENHDAIIAQWEDRYPGDDSYGVVADLLEQKEQAAKKAEEKAAKKEKEAVSS